MRGQTDTRAYNSDVGKAFFNSYLDRDKNRKILLTCGRDGNIVAYKISAEV